MDAVVDFCQDAAGYVGVMRVQLQVVEEELQLGDGQIYQFGDVASSPAYVVCFGLQAGTVAFGTERFPR